jgi:fucose 4-O-acetylase-like acetyltransferase
MNPQLMLSNTDSDFLKYMRAMGMFAVIFGHLGAGWVFPPYSYYIYFFAGIFFSASGAVNYFSFKRSDGIINFLKKRIISLYLPYVLFCLIAFIIFIIYEKQFPQIKLNSIIQWILIRPSRDIAPFPLFQLWFVRTLVAIMILSPFLYICMDRFKKICAVVFIIVIFLSYLELPVDESVFVSYFGIDAYRIIFYSAFFMVGAIIFKSIHFFTGTKILFLSGLCLCIALITAFFSQDPSSHINDLTSPDLCYAAASLSSFLLLLFLKKQIVQMINKINILTLIFNTFNKYSLGILLFHTLAIKMSEKFCVDHISSEFKILFLSIEIVLTLIITFSLTIPFHAIADRLITKINY